MSYPWKWISSAVSDFTVKSTVPPFLNVRRLMPPTGLAFLTTTTLAGWGWAPPVPLSVLLLPLLAGWSVLSLPPDRARTNATTMTTTARPSRTNRWFRDTMFSLLGCSGERISRAPEERGPRGGGRACCPWAPPAPSRRDAGPGRAAARAAARRAARWRPPPAARRRRAAPRRRPRRRPGTAG